MEKDFAGRYYESHIEIEYERLKSNIQKCKEKCWSIESLVDLASCVESYIYYHDSLAEHEKENEK